MFMNLLGNVNIIQKMIHIYLYIHIYIYIYIHIHSHVIYIYIYKSIYMLAVRFTIYVAVDVFAHELVYVLAYEFSCLCQDPSILIFTSVCLFMFSLAYRNM